MEDRKPRGRQWKTTTPAQAPVRPPDMQTAISLMTQRRRDEILRRITTKPAAK